MTTQPVLVERSFEVDAPRDRVWAFMRDPASFSSCIPGVSDVEALSDGTFSAVVGVKVSILTARFAVSVRIVEEDSPRHLVAEMSGTDAKTGTRLETRNEVHLRQGDDGITEVAFRIDARLSGKLAALGGGMAVKLKSRQMAKTFAKEVKARIETTNAFEKSNRE